MARRGCRTRGRCRRPAAVPRRRCRGPGGSRTALAYSARFRRCVGTRPGSTVAAAVRSSSASSHPAQLVEGRPGGTRPAGRGHHAAAQLQDHPLPDIGGLADAGHVRGVEGEPPRLQPLVVAGDAVAVEQCPLRRRHGRNALRRVPAGQVRARSGPTGADGGGPGQHRYTRAAATARTIRRSYTRVQTVGGGDSGRAGHRFASPPRARGSRRRTRDSPHLPTHPMEPADSAQAPATRPVPVVSPQARGRPPAGGEHRLPPPAAPGGPAASRRGPGTPPRLSTRPTEPRADFAGKSHAPILGAESEDHRRRRPGGSRRKPRRRDPGGGARR